MTVDNIILLTIVSSFFACGYTAPKVLSDEFTIGQFAGEWFEIGKISDCSDIMPYPCVIHQIMTSDDSAHEIYHMVFPNANILNCDRGVPIYTHVTSGYFINATIYVNETDSDSLFDSTIKSYNNGKELIFTETRNESCSNTSYRLWSRERKVSAETKAEFEKLAGNRTTEYYSLDHCPKARSENHERLIDLKFDGLWYEIAEINYGLVHNHTCITYNTTVNYDTNAFSQISNSIRYGRPYKVNHTGKFTKSAILYSRPGAERKFDYMQFYGISCNNGEDMIFVQDCMPALVLLSRYPKVSGETMAGFESLADILEKIYPDDRPSVTYVQKNCPKSNV